MPALTAPSCSKSCPAHSWRWADWPDWRALDQCARQLSSPLSWKLGVRGIPSFMALGYTAFELQQPRRSLSRGKLGCLISVNSSTWAWSDDSWCNAHLHKRHTESETEVAGYRLKLRKSCETRSLAAQTNLLEISESLLADQREFIQDPHTGRASMVRQPREWLMLGRDSV